MTFVIVSTTMNVDVPLWMWPLSRLATIESSFRSNAFLAGRTLKSLYDKVWRALEQITPRRDYWARRRPSKPTIYPFYGSPSWEHYFAPVQSRHRRSPATCYSDAQTLTEHGVHAPRSPSAARGGRVLLPPRRRSIPHLRRGVSRLAWSRCKFRGHVVR